jgi:tetratricopeptide (TPR) repeat protein
MIPILLVALLAGAPATQTPDPKLEANLAAAKKDFEANPSADTAIWYGRRTAYLGRYREAIDIYTAAIAKYPQDPRLYRHRGHRYITVREFDKAIADFRKAAELAKGKPDDIEPDGQPNARGIPTSTLKTNIYYHLGLAHYLKGEFEPALQAYDMCIELSKNDDMRVATNHWRYMTLRRLNRLDQAARVLDSVKPTMDIIENGSYHKLLLMYKGEIAADTLMDTVKAGGLDGATIGYGVANWHLYNGRGADAVTILKQIVDDKAAQKSSFGYIAAEAELARRSAR